MTKQAQIENIIDCLNTAFKADPDAVYIAMCNRVPCNLSLVNHPHVVVANSIITNGWTVGTLGIINGILTSANLPRVAMKWSDDKNIKGQYDFLGFCIASKESQPTYSQIDN